MTTDSYITTIRVRLENLRALERIREKRHRATGRRPSMRALMLEAIDTFVRAKAMHTRGSPNPSPLPRPSRCS